MTIAWRIAMAAWIVAELIVMRRLMTGGFGPLPWPAERRRRLRIAAWILAFIGLVLSNAAHWLA